MSIAKFKRPTIAEYLAVQISLSEKSQREIAAEISYENPNVITMFKQGQTKVPMNKVGPLAKALGFGSSVLPASNDAGIYARDLGGN